MWSHLPACARSRSLHVSFLKHICKGDARSFSQIWRSSSHSVFHQQALSRSKTHHHKVSFPAGSIAVARPIGFEPWVRSLSSASTGTQSLRVKLGGKEVAVPLLWLRDHCRCSSCYNHITFQKKVDSYSLSGLAVAQSKVEGDTLSVTWQDDHISTYSVQWLEKNFSSPATEVERFLWDGAQMNEQQMPSTKYESHMNSEEGLKNTLSNIIKYGFCIVEGTPATKEETEKVSSRIGVILDTMYGRVSVMVSGQLDHSDTAYTNVALGAHNDTTYFTIPAGVQVFHCLGHDGEGGNTLLVDGFSAAEKLRRDNPSFFNTLSSTIVPHEYIGSSHYHLYSLATVLSTDQETGALTQIRYNPYDRAPLRTVAAEDIGQFYASYDALTSIIRSPASEFWVKLRPGMVLLVDNWRVMHGRSSFTGRRTLCGLYLPRDEWTSRARVLGLL